LQDQRIFHVLVSREHRDEVEHLEDKTDPVAEQRQLMNRELRSVLSLDKYRASNESSRAFF
jgi:hypothetical protein